MLRERFKEHRQATNNPNHSNATAAVPTHFKSAKGTRLQPGVTITTAQQQRIPTKSERGLPQLYHQMALRDEQR